MKTIKLLNVLFIICLVVYVRLDGQTKRTKLTNNEIMEVGKKYEKVLDSKKKLFKKIGSKPIGKYNADGLDLTVGKTELSGKYNKLVTLSILVHVAGEFCPAEKVDEYYSLREELADKGVMSVIEEIQNAQTELGSKLNAISKRGITIENTDSVYTLYFNLKSKK
jgi:hypothetical protein